MVRMPKGDGSPCDDAFEWIESKKFKNREDVDMWFYRHQEIPNKYMKECIDNYPWEIENDDT